MFGGNEALALELVEARAGNVSVANHHGAAPLHGAALLGLLALQRALLARGADARRADESGITPLHSAALQAHVECARELLAAGAELRAATVDGQTPLHYACAGRGAPAVVALLLGAADARAAVDRTDHDGRTALHYCSARGHNESVSALLAFGADALVRDHAGETPMYAAFPVQQTWSVKAFLDAGAPGLNTPRADGATILHWAAGAGFPELTERLLNHSADIHALDNDGMSAAHYAAAGNHGDVLRVLFERGADMLAVDHRGRGVLHHGASAGSRFAVLLALSKRADINSATRPEDDSQTPLHLACKRPRKGLIAELTSYGADETRRDANGNTPLHVCVRTANAYGVEELLAAGADPLATNNEGQTPRDTTRGWRLEMPEDGVELAPDDGTSRSKALRAQQLKKLESLRKRAQTLIEHRKATLALLDEDRPKDT